MTQDDIKNYLVCVNGGSGVIFQPGNEKFSYVLTAKHVFDDINTEAYNGKVKVFYFNPITNSYDPPLEFELIVEDNYFPHVEAGIDIAILKVSRIDCPEKILIKEDIAEDIKDYMLVGFPALRRTNKSIDISWWRQDLGVELLKETTNKRREADINKCPDWNQLVGSSGGGIVRIFGDYLLLAGIQSQVVSDEENLGRIEFTPTRVFNEIVLGSNGKLEALLPNYMKCFSFLKDKAFKLEVELFDEPNIEFTRNYLQNKAQDVINSKVTPIIIKSYFEKRLLVNEVEEDALYSSMIWLIWLEFLTIMNIIKYEIFDESQLDEIFNSFRLKYSNTSEDWLSLIKTDLLYSDYHGLKPGSNIFIGTKKSPIKTLVIPQEKIIEIARVYDKNKFKTDKGIHPFTHFRFIHTNYLQKACIIDKLEKYATIHDEEKLLLILKNEYDELFK